MYNIINVPPPLCTGFLADGSAVVICVANGSPEIDKIT